MPGKGLLERLADGVVIGDGGYVTIMEKRGYARIGVWTPEATVEHPEAGARCDDKARSIKIWLFNSLHAVSVMRDSLTKKDNFMDLLAGF